LKNPVNSGAFFFSPSCVVSLEQRTKKKKTTKQERIATSQPVDY
jgi:hypothetical protein